MSWFFRVQFSFALFRQNIDVRFFPFIPCEKNFIEFVRKEFTGVGSAWLLIFAQPWNMRKDFSRFQWKYDFRNNFSRWFTGLLCGAIEWKWNIIKDIYSNVHKHPIYGWKNIIGLISLSINFFLFPKIALDFPENKISQITKQDVHIFYGLGNPH